LGRGRRLESGDERRPDLAPGFVDGRVADVSLGRFAPEKHLPYALHLLANLFELRHQGVGVGPMFFELRAPRLGDAVYLFPAFALDRRIAHLLQICECGIHHARARRVETTGQLFERLNDLVAVARTLGEQRQNNELQVVGAELAAHENAASSESTTVDEGRPEGTEVPSERAPRAPVVEAKTMHGRILSSIVRHVISYVLRYILSSPCRLFDR